MKIRRLFLKKRLSYSQKVYENLCELLVEDSVIKVPEFQGVFAVDCRSDLFKRLLYHKEYEPSLVNLALKYLDKNRDAIDIGANVGFYTVLFARTIQNGRVLAIEPTLNSLRRLNRNIQLNGVAKKTIVFGGAASDYTGKGEIKSLKGKEEYSTLGCWKHPSIKNENFSVYDIEISTVDRLVSQYALDPGFMKIDVEGLECPVLKGAKNTIKTRRPIILSELSDCLLRQNGSSSIEVVQFIESLNYTVVNAEVPEIRPETTEFANILCIPRELGG
jgi:FkbM family methyltransferase